MQINMMKVIGGLAVYLHPVSRQILLRDRPPLSAVAWCLLSTFTHQWHADRERTAGWTSFWLEVEPSRRMRRRAVRENGLQSSPPIAQSEASNRSQPASEEADHPPSAVPASRGHCSLRPVSPPPGSTREGTCYSYVGRGRGSSDDTLYQKILILV